MKPKILKSFMSPHECEILCSYINLRTKTGRVAKRMLKSGKVWEVHGTALTDSIGLTYLHSAEELFKKRLSKKLIKWINMEIKKRKNDTTNKLFKLMSNKVCFCKVPFSSKFKIAYK